MTHQTPLLEIASMVTESGGRDAYACMQCGTCTGVCPWATRSSYNPRAMIRQISLGLEGWEEQQVWRCVQCGACLSRCPRSLGIVDIILAARRTLQQAGTAPRSQSGPLSSLRTFGNPWEGDPDKRSSWCSELNLPSVQLPCDNLLMTCCTQIYDPRNRQAAQALLSLLSQAAFPFTAHPESHRCCGEQAYRMGAEEVAYELVQSNLAFFQQQDGAQPFTSSPHCMQMMKQQGVSCRHSLQVLLQCLEQNRLDPSVPIHRIATYHDPCLLGRYLGEYEAPRHILSKIQGLQFVELPRNREDSLCCGGGGGGIFLEVPKEERFAVERVEEALATGADLLITACPYCLLMFEDAIKVLGIEQRLEVRDLGELLRMAVPSKENHNE